MRSKFFPQELIDTTIDHLHDDLASLRCCSAVCRAWVHSSQLHLFTRINFRTLATDATILYPRLYHRLCESPHLATYIRDVSLGVFPRDNQLPHSQEWLDAEGTLILLLPMLSNLERFELFPYKGPGLFRSIFNIEPALLAMISTTFRLPSVSVVELAGWHFQTFRDFLALVDWDRPTLKTVKLARLTFDNGYGNDTLQPLEGQNSISLDELHISYCTLSPVVSWMSNSWSHISVRSLHLEQASHFEDFGELLDTFSPSLEHLHLKVDNIRVSGLYVIDLARLHSLRSVSVTVFIFPMDNPIPRVTRLLSCIRAPNHIKHIKIRARFSRQTTGINYAPWRGIDRVLSCSELSCLEAVEVCLFMSQRQGELSTIMKCVEQEMPELRARGILRIYEEDLRTHVYSRTPE